MNIRRLSPFTWRRTLKDAHSVKSGNDQLFKVIDTVNHIGKKGMYAIDRGGDRGKPYDKFLEKDREKRFVIRLTKMRDPCS